MSGQGRRDCGCCAGISIDTPVAVTNRPGLSAILYRIGTYQGFRQSLHARLSASRLPRLRGLRTRDRDDFTIALLDAWAVTGDILTFYQERIANESYLRTATERLSILEQSRLTGYRLGPGLAATTHVAFTMEEAPGDPVKSAWPTSLAAGIKIQSVPGPGETPQTFETTESIQARPAWNAIQAQLTEPQRLSANMTSVWLSGTTLTLAVGDLLLIVVSNAGDAFEGSLHRVIRIEPNNGLGSTKVSLTDIPGSAGTIAATEPGVFVMRTIASPFGHNAPQRAIYKEGQDEDGNNIKYVDFKEWGLDHELPFQLTLNSRQDKILVGSWAAVERLNDSGDLTWIFAKIIGAAHHSVAKYGIAGNATTLTFQSAVWTEHGADLGSLRQITVASQSEPLPIANHPLSYPVYGKSLALDTVVDGLLAGRPIAVSGKRQIVRVKQTGMNSTLQLESGNSVPLAPGDQLRIVGIPMKRSGKGFVELLPADFVKGLEGSTALLLLKVMDRDGQTGTLKIELAGLELVPSNDKDETVTEVVFLHDNPATAVIPDRDRITLQLAGALANVYERASVRINANVAAATHGESVKEPLGSGDAAIAYQQFTLKQPPVTYVSADTPNGSASTLKVYVNDVLWNEVPFFFGHGPTEGIYITRRDDEGRTTIRFGDGITGARLPTGQNNVRAEYRKGTGLAGLVRAGQLSLLMSRPLGLKGVVNPEAAQGAEDPESRDDARMNAPLTVLTMERAVSLQDYEDFARTFSGIAKAQSVWLWDGRNRSIFLTVAGPGGEMLEEDGSVITKLKESLRRYGDPFVAFTVKPYRQAWFEVGGTVTIDPDHVSDIVMDAITADLKEQYAFEARAFGQPVAMSELIALIQAIPGVVAVDLDRFARRGDSSTLVQARLIANRAGMGADKELHAAELLLFDPASFTQLKAV